MSTYSDMCRYFESKDCTFESPDPKNFLCTTMHVLYRGYKIAIMDFHSALIATGKGWRQYCYDTWAFGNAPHWKTTIDNAVEWAINHEEAERKERWADEVFDSNSEILDAIDRLP